MFLEISTLDLLPKELELLQPQLLFLIFEALAPITQVHFVILHHPQIPILHYLFRPQILHLRHHPQRLWGIPIQKMNYLVHRPQIYLVI